MLRYLHTNQVDVFKTMYALVSSIFSPTLAYHELEA